MWEKRERKEEGGEVSKQGKKKENKSSSPTPYVQSL